MSPATIREWAHRLPAGADASPTLTAKFRERFPTAVVECGPIENSAFFHRTFDAIVSWGLLFLLPPAEQLNLIATVATTRNLDGNAEDEGQNYYYFASKP